MSSNTTNWQMAAAKEWCLDRGYEFAMLTENELGINNGTNRI